jgi:hypothetical protein
LVTSEEIKEILRKRIAEKEKKENLRLYNLRPGRRSSIRTRDMPKFFD